MWPQRTTEQKEESMNMIASERIIGIDVSRDWMDIHCLPNGQRARLPNRAEGHDQLIDLAQALGALVCFEATGGQEWRLWTALDAAGIATRQLPPAQVKAFAASRGTRAKTDRIDAELIARFMRCPAGDCNAICREGHSAPMPGDTCRMKSCAFSGR
jgi:transposase